MATETVTHPSIRSPELIADRPPPRSDLSAHAPHAPFSGAGSATDPVASALAKLYELPTVASAVVESLPVPETVSSTPELTGDQRYFPRRTAAGFVSVVRFPPGAEVTPQWTDWLMQTSGLTGELVDLSRSGLALVLLQPFTMGDAVVVRLSQQDSDDTLDAVAEVVRSIDLGDQRWKIMAQFTRPLDFEKAYEFASHDQDALPPLFATT